MTDKDITFLYSKTMKPGLPQDQQFYHPQLITIPPQPYNFSTPLSRFSQGFLNQRKSVCWQLSDDQSGLQLKSHFGFGALNTARNASHTGSFFRQPLQGMMGSQSLSSQWQSNGHRVYEMNVASLRQKMAQYSQKSKPLNSHQLSQSLHQQPSKGLQELQSQRLQQKRSEEQSQASVLQRHQQLQLQKIPENTSKRAASLTELEANATASDTNISGGGLRQEAKPTDQFLGEREIRDLVHEVDLCGDLGSEIEELLAGVADGFFYNVDTWKNLDFDEKDLFPEIVGDFVDIQQHQESKQQLQQPFSQQHQRPVSPKIQEHVSQQQQRPVLPKIQEHDGQKTVTMTGSRSNMSASPMIIPCEVPNQGAKAAKQLLGKRKSQESLPKIQEHVSQQHQRPELPKIWEHVSQQHQRPKLPKIQEHDGQRTVTLTGSRSNVTASPMIIPAEVSNQGAKATKQLLGKRKSQELQQQKQQLQTPVSQQHQGLKLPKTLGPGCQVKRVHDISALFGSSQVLGGDGCTRPLMSSSQGLKQLISQSTDSNKKRRI